MTNIDEPIRAETTFDSIQPNLSQSHLAYWRSSSPTVGEITLSLSEDCIAELEQGLRRTGDAEVPDTSDPTQYQHCLKFSERLKSMINHDGLGVAIIDRVPAERFNEMDNRRICSVLASFVGPLMAQNHAGVTLYDVKNTSPANPEKVRKSITNFAQTFHADGGWLRKPAKYVGLYCVRNARKGGGSRVTSIVSAFETMLEKHPSHLETLLRPAPWDKQGEYAPGDYPTTDNPMFEVHGKQLMSRYYESYIRNGYKILGKEIDSRLDDALNCIRHVISDCPSVSFEMKAGQFQYLNNWSMLHAREAFDDNEATPAHLQRHVIRVWNNPD